MFKKYVGDKVKMKYMIIFIISIIVCPIIMFTGIRLQGKKEEK